MKILDVSFENFSRIYTGLGKTRLYINFEDMTNSIFLFVGANGSGKTSIMRSLHPFAYNSNAGDNTANADVIIDGKDGEKRISYSHNNNRYEIVHIYSRKKDGSLGVKSYIKENGVELNDSGTVVTFKNVVLDKLGLDESFLGLLSLGNTIDGFVKYTSANRKKFAVKIFSQLNIYNKYYKIITAKVRDTRSLLNNNTTKLERYKSYNIDELNIENDYLTSKIKSLNDELNTLMMNIGGTLQLITTNEDFIKDYNVKRTEFDTTLAQIDTLKNKIVTNKDAVVLKNDLAAISENINNAKITIAALESNLKSETDIRESKVSTINTLKDNVERMSKHIDLKELTELKASLSAELESLGISDDMSRPPVDKESLIKTNIYLDELRGMCIDLVNDVTNIDLIPEILQEYLKDNSIVDKFTSRLNELEYDYNQIKSLTLSKTLLDNMHIRKVTSNCDNKNGCPYVKFHNDVMSVINQSITDTDNELSHKRTEINNASDKVRITSILSRLYKFINKNSEYFNISKDVFNKDTFVLQYLMDRTVYDGELLSKLISTIELFDRKDVLENQIADTNNKIASLSETKVMHDDILQQITQLESAIKDSDTILASYRSDLEFNKSKLEELESVYNDVNNQMSIMDELTEARNKLNTIKIEIGNMEDKMSEVSKAQNKYNLYKSKETSIKNDILEAESRQKSIVLIINSIEELEREQKELLEKYNTDKMIQEAVSPTSGIPLDFINFYIKEEMIGKVNELLDMVYHGHLVLDKKNTVISEDEFTIPYKKRSTIIADISKASDGEKAIISLAFSLVLLRMTAGPYNILLLDEMDTALDAPSRAKYIELLSQFMSMIKADQLFLISHNSMFDVYPVNVLLTSQQVVNMQNAHIKELY